MKCSTLDKGLTRKPTIWKRLWGQRELQLMILPLVAIVILFQYLPMYGLLIAFKNYKISVGVFDSPWARNGGLEHFIDFFRSPSIMHIIWNTVYISLLKLLFLSFPPVMLAIILNEIKHERFKKITQTISYIPHFVSWVILGGIIGSLLSSDGLVNQLMIAMGVQSETIVYLGQPQFFRPLLVLSNLWKDVGWGSILYLAVFSTIDPNLYEALEIDGGGRWAKIRYINWPFAKGVFFITFILSCGSIMSGMGDTFEQVYIMGNPMVQSVAQILDTYVLRVGLEQGRYSYAAAVGLFKNIINLVLLISANKLSKSITGKSLY